jgi:hypothetical protein
MLTVKCWSCVQVVLAHALLQWPYLSDLTLVSAIISVFHSEWGLAPKLPPAWLQLKRNAWLYFNLVLTDSQVCGLHGCLFCIACWLVWP